jgi:uncharacterized membrane protein
MKIRTIAVNGIVAAVYIVVLTLINPFAFLVNQFRLPEMLNHLVVFNKKLFFGIVVGVFISNLLYSPLLPLDLIYGVTHTVLSLTITLIIARFVKNMWARMAINTVVFSFMMFIIAHEIVLIDVLPFSAFVPIWVSLAISEFLVMATGIPVIYLINKRLKFEEII